MSIVQKIESVKKKLKEKNVELSQRLDELEEKHRKMIRIVQTETIGKCGPNSFCDYCNRVCLRYA